jgi:ATP-dependent DNA helicase RecG
MASGGQRDLTAEIATDIDDTDLDPQEVSELRKVIRQHAQGAGLANLEDSYLLSSLGLVTEKGFTLAGLLLVGKTEAIHRHVPQHEVVFLRFRSGTKYDQRRDLRGPLLSILREMERLVSVNNRLTTIREEGFGQLEFPDLSWEVAREAVLNAVTHRDYFLRQGVQVALYRDRLEVVSPGGFVGGITPENILRHPPVHRNELLARVFQSMGFVNRVGLGVDRIYEGILRLGKDVPRYTADESHVRLVIPLKTDTSFALFLAQEERKKGPFEMDDLLILRELTKISSLDRWSAARILQLTEDEAATRLVRLRESGYLVVRGRGRGAAYDLKRDLADRLRGRAAVDATLPLEEEAVNLRVLALLRERGRLTNAEIRRFSGFNRTQVYRMIKKLEKENRIRFAGKGRGAHILPVKIYKQGT